MATKTTCISIRIPAIQHSDLRAICKAKGITQAEFSRNALFESMSNQTSLDFGDGGSLPSTLKRVAISDAEMNTLTTLGLGTVAGIMGYKLIGWGRKKYGYNEDKQLQFMGGVSMALITMFGLATLFTKGNK